VSVAPRRWGTLLQDIVADLVAQDPAFWDNPWLRDPSTATNLPTMLALLGERLRATDPATTLQRLAARGTDVDGVTVSHHLRDAAAVDAIGPDDPLTRADSVTVEVIEHGKDKVRARINGGVYSLPIGVVHALDTLTDGRTRTAATLLADAPAELSIRTARTLVRIGVLRAP
jgi:hypothetical protein